ncbi:hypothetical protein LRP52_40875 [Photobacterium sp. ZSDE20]|uniref:Uncharacterized protein n=1 Tax=Photobacterium pectinilyticum TaxID=2906793 RepID=A0ABT1N7T1_9GAMM|nr:hypothetical protein [Photobacterium sp. ZSDE20]MCQ1060795.1 hypothetical protein [Photobacterium sp. ZSDE20]MDD1828539.1 hypothetical protein [Photobacterium sp. ZSDE20]
MYPIEHIDNALYPLPREGIYLNSPERHLLWEVLRIPPDSPYAEHAIPLYLQFHHCCGVFESDVNIYYRRQRQTIVSLLEQLQPKTAETPPSLPATRQQLRTYLTHYPLFSSLLLIGNEDDSSQPCWLWLLVRLYHAVGPDAYDVYLLFDQLRRRYPKALPFLSMGVLTQGSQHELAQALKQHTHLAALASHVIARQKRASRQPYQADNNHTGTELTCGLLSATLHTTSDSEGNEGESWLAMTANQPLNTKAAKRQFALQGSGMARAIGRANQSLPASSSVLTPSELRIFIIHACPAILEGEWLAIAPRERKYWLVFWLSLLGRADIDTPVHNLRGKQKQALSSPAFLYELDTLNGCIVSLQLGADLVKGAKPEQGDKRYCSAQYDWSLMLPWPIQSLFNLILRELPSHRRNGQTLSQVLLLSSEDYGCWLKAQIKAVTPSVPFSLTPSALHQSFVHFSREQVPDTALALLTGKGCVQSHYINQQITRVSGQIRQCWQWFLTEIGVTRALDSSSETHVSMTWGVDTYHEQVGSALTLRKELLCPIFSAILPAPDPKLWLLCRRQPQHLQEKSERLALYLHLRAAITMALRPVSHPYPDISHMAFETGLLTVQDKRSHHHDERRVIVADPMLMLLLKRYVQWQDHWFPLAVDHKPLRLCVFDGEKAEPLSKPVVSRLLERYVGDSTLGGFRHLSASLWLEANDASFETPFIQSSLNQLLNHFQRGQSPLGTYSLLSLNQVTVYQQQGLVDVVAPFDDYDKQALAVLKCLLTDKGGGWNVG